MGLFLPVLLLGLFQPADQPASQPTSQPTAQAQQSLSSVPATSAINGTQADGHQQKPFDRIEPDSGKPIEGAATCLTMRSYYFEREDDLAPELTGMTTCENARNVRNRNAKKGLKPRLVPATSAPAN